MSSAVRRVGASLASAILLLVATALPSSASAGLEPDQEAAERAAREIADARDRANDAAEQFFAAESRLGLLQLEQERLQLEVIDLAETVAKLKADVELVAVNRFVASGASGIPILTDLREPTEQLHGGVLAEVVAESGATTLDDYEEARTALVDKEAELDDAEEALERHQAEMLDLQAEAEAEVERLREIESQRLQDEAVQIALLAQQREEARQLAELERRQAEAARTASDAGQIAAASVSAASSDGETTGNLGASGGSAGGRTGGGGGGTNPRAAGAGFVDSIICPVQGPSAYGDTWGAPRSGGRRHQGTDMLAPTGTPLQAVIGGEAAHRSNPLGGITISLLGDNGNRYYYAHLVAYEGPPGRVEQGQVIGYIGDTGNATGVPHLHFEIRPGGGVPVNPYPSVRAAGC
jgi:murein DD-endopeptidase MepM/ murein hydrolase activator NlpD